MQKWTIIGLAFFFLARPYVPLLEYAIRYEFISSELCRNKDLPILDCRGKCYLSQQLAEAMAEQTNQTGKEDPPVPRWFDPYCPLDHHILIPQRATFTSPLQTTPHVLVYFEEPGAGSLDPPPWTIG